MLHLSPLFSDHMVLQRDKPVAVFGDADGDVTITLNGCTVTVSPVAGRFIAYLPPMPAGGPHTLCVRCGAQTERCDDVMLGEVWLCGGQSNMELKLRDSADGLREAAVADDPRVRFYIVPQTATLEEAERAEPLCGWQVLTPGACGDVTAVGYYAARALADALDVAVGVVGCYIGGTSASCWMATDELCAFPEGEAYVRDFLQRIEGKSDEQFARESAAYQEQVDAYNEALNALRRARPHIKQAQIEAELGLYPWPPPDGRTMLRRPGGPYETMLLRAAPYTLRGCFYYQGEQDAISPWAPGYAALLTRMVASWRRALGDASLPMLMVQLPRYGADPAAEDWPTIRRAQQTVCDTVPGCALACLIDGGEVDNIHPVDKRMPGERLAKLALARVYGLPCPREAPRAVSATLVGDWLILSIQNAGGGLTLRGQPSLTVEGARVTELVLRPNALMLRLDCAPTHVAVSYAQTNCPEATLFGQNGLPLMPFALEAWA